VYPGQDKEHHSKGLKYVRWRYYTICPSLDFDVLGNRVNITNMLSSKQDSYIYFSFEKDLLLKKLDGKVIKRIHLLDDNIAITEHDNSLHAHQILL